MVVCLSNIFLFSHLDTASFGGAERAVLKGLIPCVFAYRSHVYGSLHSCEVTDAQHTLRSGASERQKGKVVNPMWHDYIVISYLDSVWFIILINLSFESTDQKYPQWKQHWQTSWSECQMWTDKPVDGLLCFKSFKAVWS